MSDPTDLNAAEVRSRLALPAHMLEWLERIERPAAARTPVLPDDAEAERLLGRLGVESVDRDSTLAARPNPHDHPELWWVLERVYHHLLAKMGCGVPIEGFEGWPPLPVSTGAVGRHLYVWLYLAVLPEARRYQASREIPEDVTWVSLDGLGRGMRAHRAVTGEGGLGLFRLWSPPLQLRGAEYRLGLLGFNRGAVSMGNGACGYVLGVHIPEGGKLEPDACEESFAAAREFFPRHFPEEPVSFFTCSSWLMDPQLAEYLPEGSNIVRFQRRFHLLPLTPQEAASPEGDRAILGHVFGRYRQPDTLSEVLDELPRDTTLQRAYVAHLRSGGHWHSRTGWFPF